MNLIAAVKSCFTNYAKFDARANRAEFWYWCLFLVLSGTVFVLLDALVLDRPLFNKSYNPFFDTFRLLVFIPTLAVGWRRLHDTGRSGWWIGGGLLVLAVGSTLLSSLTFALANDPDLTSALNDRVPVNSVLMLGNVALWSARLWLLGLLILFCLPTQQGANKYNKV